MKKMLMYAAAAVIGLSACSKDEDDDSNGSSDASIVGLWTTSELGIVASFNSVVISDSTYMWTTCNLDFKNDGTVTITADTTDPNNVLDFDASETSFYTVSGSNLVIKDSANDPEPTALTIATLTNNNLTLKQTETEVNGTITTTYDVTIKAVK